MSLCVKAWINHSADGQTNNSLYKLSTQLSVCDKKTAAVCTVVLDLMQPMCIHVINEINPSLMTIILDITEYSTKESKNSCPSLTLIKFLRNLYCSYASLQSGYHSHRWCSSLLEQKVSCKPLRVTYRDFGFSTRARLSPHSASLSMCAPAEKAVDSAGSLMRGMTQNCSPLKTKNMDSCGYSASAASWVLRVCLVGEKVWVWLL